jgi:hypothetical protein
VAKTNPARDKVEERVRGCLARAHRIQLKMITASQGPHTTRVTPIAFAGVSTGLTLLPESATYLLTQVTKAVHIAHGGVRSRIDVEHWKRVDDLLQAALPVPAERQEEFLVILCQNTVRFWTASITSGQSSS